MGIPDLDAAHKHSRVAGGPSQLGLALDRNYHGAIYLAYRVIGWILLSTFGFPVSFIPVMLLLVAFVIDVAVSRRWSALMTALALVVMSYPFAALIGNYTLMPEFAFATAPIMLLALWGGLAVDNWRRRRSGKIAMQAV